MKITTCLLILGLVAIVSCSNVLNLTDQNFNSTISGHKYVMVKFFAPWCGHCKSMAPQYEKLADLAKENDIIIGQVDATISKDVAQAHKVQGYPTVKFFIDGVSIDYRGPRTANEMYGWIKKVSQTVLEQISQQKIDQLKTKQHLVIYFGSNQEKRKTIELLNIADNSIDYFVSSSEDDKLVLYPLGRQSINYPTNLSFTNDQIQKWAMMNTIPTVVPLSSKQYLDWVFYDQATMKDVVMLLREDDVSDAGYKNFEQLCQNNKQNFKCCVIEQNHEVYGGVKNYLRSKGQSVLALARDALKEAYAYPNSINELTEQSWKTFTTQVDEGKHNNLAGEQGGKIEFKHVKVLTDSNFTSFIKENEVVFIQFFTTTCPHCVEFSKQYDQLAKKVYADESLNYEIAALDIKKNKQTASELRITSFPTFMVYVSGHSVLYDGPRTHQSILNFIKTVKDSKPIAAGSIAEVPSPSVIIYDPAETTSLKFLPALFTRYPIYHIRQGKLLKIVLREETQQTYNGELELEQISKWLFKKTDPVLVDLLNANIENKLREALENKIHILGLIDIEPSLSVSLKGTLEEYCKVSSLVCGFAKKDDTNFPEFVNWLGIDAETTSSFIYINTETFDRYLFPNRIEQLSVESITQFVTDVQSGKVTSITDSKIETQKAETPEQKKQEAKKEEPESKETEQSDNKKEEEL